MKAKIHPDYVTCKVTCGCGTTFETRSTMKEIKVEICSACHPFYTGRQRYVDTAGRIEKFNRRFKGFDSSAEGRAEEAAEHAAAATAAVEATPASDTAPAADPAATAES